MIGQIASFLNLVGPDLVVIMLILAVLCGIPALVIFIVNRRGKKPEEAGAAKSYEGIGGWLILVAFILIRAPIAVIVTLFRAVFPLLQHDTWIALTSKDSELFHPLWAPLIIAELVVNIAFLGFALVVLVLFFRRKKSFPKFVITLYLAHLVWEVSLSLIYRMIPTTAEAGASSLVNIVGLALACAIWIPYFLISKRVRATFTK
ncbi:MAG: DUF2569 domain-containing protein [Verrucomicrobiota bacterium]